MELDWDTLSKLYRIDALQDKLKGFYPGKSTFLDQCFDAVFSGNLTGSMKQAFANGLSNLSASLDSYRYVLITLIGMGILSALLSLSTNMFQSLKQVKYGTYFILLSVTGIVLQCFIGLYESCKQLLEQFLLFIRLIVPAYLLTLGASVGGGAALSWKELIVLVFYAVQKVVLAVFLPAVTVYVLLVTINALWAGKRCDYLLHLLGQGFRLGIGLLVTFFSGLSFLQRLISPMAGKIGRQVLLKPLEMLPGVGNAAEGVTDMLLGSATIIKNGVGVFLFLVICTLFLMPLLKLLVTVLVLRASAAMMGLVSQREAADLVNGYAEGVAWLFRITAVSVFLFLILLACMTSMAIVV